MPSRFLSLLSLATLSCFGAQVKTLRVCADPNNMPLSNEAGQGLENKLAALTAATLGYKLEYTWWSERKSFLRQSLGAGRCDVVMGVPSTLDSVDVTKPYYRSSYVFVSRADRLLHLTSLADPQLARLRIGVHVVGDDLAPPAFALARRGITQNVVGFSLLGAFGEENPQRKIIDAVERGEVDVAIVWGPLAGYFARQPGSKLDIQPVSPPVYLGIPFTYEISMAVRKGDGEMETALNNALQSEASAVGKILTEYGVPQVP